MKVPTSTRLEFKFGTVDCESVDLKIVTIYSHNHEVAKMYFGFTVNHTVVNNIEDMDGYDTVDAHYYLHVRAWGGAKAPVKTIVRNQNEADNIMNDMLAFIISTSNADSYTVETNSGITHCTVSDAGIAC